MNKSNVTVGQSVKLIQRIGNLSSKMGMYGIVIKMDEDWILVYWPEIKVFFPLGIWHPANFFYGPTRVISIANDK